MANYSVGQFPDSSTHDGKMSCSKFCTLLSP